MNGWITGDKQIKRRHLLLSTGSTGHGSGLQAVDAAAELQHLLVVGVNGEGGAAVAEGAGDVPDVLVEGSAEMEEVQVCLERNRPRQLRYRLLLLLAVHQH